MQARSNPRRRRVRIDIVNLAVFAAAHGGNHRNITACYGIVNDLCVDFHNVAHKADVLACVVLFRLNHIAVQAAKPHSLPAVAS